MSQLELNKGDNFILCGDVSGSMAEKDCPGGLARIDYMKEQFRTFASAASDWDEDGIDLITFGHQVKVFPNVSADKALEIINGMAASEASTDTAGAIKKAYARHKETGSEQTFCMIFTDGEPADRKAVQNEIIRITNDVKSEKEFRLLFLSVGKISSSLQAFLTGLDDDLKGAKHDIVDVKAIESVDFMAAVAGALTD